MKTKVILIMLAVSVILIGCNQQETLKTSELVHKAADIKEETKEIPPVVQEPKGPTSTTTGLPIDEDDTESNSFAVMVENSPNARPHTGLANADIVYEMEVEGNVTRFLAIFNDDIPDKIGPVRSSRHYYLPVVESWNVPYIHYGGSPQAYDRLKSLSVPSIDGMTNGTYFRRDSSRYAPHNAYLHTNQLRDFEMEPINGKFKFNKETDYSDASPAKALNITYNNFTHITYDYVSEENIYQRSLEGAAHVDRETGDQIEVSNVVVMYAAHQAIPGDSSGRIDITLTTQGEAVYFSNGEVVEGTWKYEDNKIRYYVEDEIISLTPGKTWIQVVNASKKGNVSY
ncbi:putative lipoprotein YerB [Paraliobacillus quinghaiensis]|uniref:Lipoprotein YerB n=1 Tax=Paraliobacillus quinghaiensis TaxID=470815 RepID=A0A917TNN6_9BACI|nr:DUF3048 domain-containing protein [Paraliobacillus quinghaiensis]GGM30656.1 putative lipoprotein YerB [Paraliobacillus quinghaiensis]